jgi:hypothetical protein
VATIQRSLKISSGHTEHILNIGMIQSEKQIAYRMHWIVLEEEEGDEASIDEYDANIQTDSYNIDWKIYEVEAE